MWVLREAGGQDAARIAALESEIFPDPWTENGIRETLCQNNTAVIGAWKDGKLAGYVILYYVLNEGEIARIAVDAQNRRQGAAGLLFERALEVCGDRGIERLMLEVRESNEVAIAFYRKCGFTRDGLRRGYYEKPKEDAVLMSRDCRRAVKSFGNQVAALTAVPTGMRETKQI